MQRLWWAVADFGVALIWTALGAFWIWMAQSSGSDWLTLLAWPFYATVAAVWWWRAIRSTKRRRISPEATRS